MTHALAEAERNSRTATARTFKKQQHMSLSRETQEMLQNAITKMASKYISAEESNVTDFHIRVNGENGELTILA